MDNSNKALNKFFSSKEFKAQQEKNKFPEKEDEAALLQWFKNDCTFLLTCYKTGLIDEMVLSYLVCGCIQYDKLLEKYESIIDKACDLELPPHHATKEGSDEAYMVKFKRMVKEIEIITKNNTSRAFTNSPSLA